MRTRRTITRLITLAVVLSTAPLFGVTPSGVGLHGEYFEATSLTGLVKAVRTDGPISFEWGSSGPGGGISSDTFSIRWTGAVVAPVTGSYTFATWSDDGVRLWVNGVKLIDNWSQHSPMRNAGTPIALVAGERYDIKLEYYENTGRSEIKLLWSYPGQAEQVTPQNYLFPPATVKYVSDLGYKTIANGWGPVEKDESNGDLAAGDGKRLTIGGRRFAKGLGVHAASDVRVPLDGAYGTFATWVGIDDEVSADHGSAIFQVWLDGRNVYESRTLRGVSSARYMSVGLKGARELRLVVLSGGDGIGYDHADWADAQLLKAGGNSDPPPTPTTTPGPIMTPAPAMPVAPTGLTLTSGDGKITLKWNDVAGSTGYNVYRGMSAGDESTTPIATLKTTTFVNTGLTNGTEYFYKVAALNAVGAGLMSNEGSATPKPPLPTAPSSLTAVPGDAVITLKWSEVAGATGYNVFRGTSPGGESSTALATGLKTNTFASSGLTNGTTYYFKVAATNMTGLGAMSNEASATPKSLLPPAPSGLTATPGDALVTLTWTAVPGATSYSVYRGGAAGAEAATPIATNLKTTTYNNINLVNGTPYFFKIAALNSIGAGPMSNEATATPQAPGPLLTPAQMSAFRFLRQATWGPTAALISEVVQLGPEAWIDQQMAWPPSAYPDELITKPNMELVQEHFFQNALTGPDQLRQRVAFALSQIWVVSAVKVDKTAAVVPYLRILQNGAFGNFRDLMRELTLSPASGEFLDMINNLKADPVKGLAPNENFGRELMQLYTIGLVELGPDGTPKTDPVTGLPIPSYDQTTVVDMARALTGWTYGDDNPLPATRLNSRKYTGPMEPVERYHDTGEKKLFGQTLAANQTATQDLDQALGIIFNHPNLPPFICKQLIQRLVTSNPSPKYIGDVAGVFRNNGAGVRGDLAAVVKAILMHPEAALGTPTSGKLDEPALFITGLVRALNAQVADHPFMSDLSADMGQRVLFAPSVFNYFSPSFRVPGSGLLGPEFQILNTATAMTRANFVKSLITGGFGSDVKFDWAPFTSLASTPGALVDKVGAVLMGGAMPPQMRQTILTAVNASPSNTEKARTAFYLTAISMQYQVEH